MAKTLFQLTEGVAPALTDYALTGQDPAGSPAMRRLTWQSIKNLFFQNVDQSLYGWIPAAATWTYESATTFTVAGNYSTILTKGMKFKLTANSVVLQGYILSATYSSPNTTVTVIGNPLTNHTFTDNYYSVASVPAGFTDWYDYTTTTGGLITTTGTIVSKVKFSGKTESIEGSFTLGASSAITGSVSFTIPVASVLPQLVDCWLQDSGTNTYKGIATISGSTVTIYAEKTNAETASVLALSSTVPFTWAVNDFISFKFDVRTA